MSNKEGSNINLVGLLVFFNGKPIAPVFFSPGSKILDFISPISPSKAPFHPTAQQSI